MRIAASRSRHNLVTVALASAAEPPGWQAGEGLFFRWHPGADGGADPNEPTTLVTFELEEADGGTRLTITGFDQIPLERGPQPIVRLADGAKVSRQAITKHLHALADAGLVASERRGRERIWAVKTRRLEEVRGYLEQISAQWDDALERLRQMVEDE